MTFRSSPVAVYSDPCHPTDGFYPGPVDTVDGFVTALTEQQGWAEVTVVVRFWIIGGLLVAAGVGSFYLEWLAT